MWRRISHRNVLLNVRSFAQETNEYNGNSENSRFVFDWNKYQDQARKAGRWESEPEKTTFIFFPGQGSQYVGMTKDLLKYRAVKDMFDTAKEILGYDLLNICLEGPQEKLNETVFCQPAVFVASLASLERLKAEYPDAIESCVATAGFSLGELTALTFAGAFPFDKALELVKIRAESMQHASRQSPGGMATVLFGHDAKLGNACQDAKDWCIDRGVENAECAVANYLFPDCKVIAGSTEALKYIEAHAKKYNLRNIRRLPVNGAFHTELMTSAVEPFSEALKSTFIEEPMIHVYSNVHGTPYRGVKDILKWLPQQIVRPVKWEQMLHILYTRDKQAKFPRTFVCGPGSALVTILKQVNARASENTTKIDS